MLASEPTTGLSHALPDPSSSEEDPVKPGGSTSVRVDPLLPTDPVELSVEPLPHSPLVKLPKLSLKKFDGDLTKWMTFWDTAVHNNPALTSIDKFSYMFNVIVGVDCI